MEWGIYREPVKVNERALLNDFKELCYLNGGTIIGEDDTDKPSFNVRCRIEGYGELSFGKKLRGKRIKIKDLTRPDDARHDVQLLSM